MKGIIYIGGLLIALFAFTFSFDHVDKKPWLKASKFNVINVQGIILFAKSGEKMERGDIYVEGTPLDFKNDISRAAIINRLRGRYILSGNKRGKIKVLPAANNISSRSGAILNVVDLKNYFEDRIMIIDKVSIEVGSEAFPMNDEQFFYLTYDHNDEEIPKKVPYDGDELILDKNEIYKIDGEPIPYEEKEMTLYYHEEGVGTKINEFTPVFPDKEILKEEVSLILKTLKKDSDEKKVNEVTAYLNEFYGKPQKENLSNWLKEEFDLEK